MWLSGLSAGLNQGVSGSIPRQGTSWVVGQVLSEGHVRGNHTLMFLSLSLSSSLPLSLKINKIFKKNEKILSRWTR